MTKRHALLVILMVNLCRSQMLSINVNVQADGRLIKESVHNALLLMDV